MASAHEKIMRRHFNFVAKIIKKSPSLSPERMMMGSPKLIWQRDVFEVELKPDTWNPAHGKTTMITDICAMNACRTIEPSGSIEKGHSGRLNGPMVD